MIGLASYGEIERLSDAQQTEALRGKEIPKNLRVIHPAPSPETVADFAEALDNVDQVMHQIRDWTEAVQARAPEEPEALLTSSP